jgi:hypothetical protein
MWNLEPENQTPRKRNPVNKCAHTVRIHKTRFVDGKDDGQQARIGQSPQTAQVTALRSHIFSHLFIYKTFFNKTFSERKLPGACTIY